MNLGVIGDLKAFTRYTPSPYYMDSFCRMFGLVYPGASGRTLNWNSVWYADDSIGVAALFMFSGVNQTTPVGTPEEEGATNNDPTVQIEAAIGDLCLTGFGRRLENPETLTLGTDQTSLFDEVSLAGVGTYNWRLKIISRLAVSENQSITVMSDQVNESATMGIAVKPTVYDSILVNPQPFLFM
ncbi:MAG: hypothetical protein QUS07_07410 [Methanothrix sp.]|nr:hypothetical protein [Methanothrix sp.]